MLSIPSSVRIFVCSVPADMRKSFSGLEQLTSDLIRQDPLSGHLFVFRNKRRDRVKILYWENGGYVIYYKLLERGSFPLPESTSGGSLRIEAADLMMILQGIDFRGVRRRRWWKPSELSTV